MFFGENNAIWCMFQIQWLQSFNTLGGGPVSPHLDMPLLLANKLQKSFQLVTDKPDGKTYFQLVFGTTFHLSGDWNGQVKTSRCNGKLALINNVSTLCSHRQQQQEKPSSVCSVATNLQLSIHKCHWSICPLTRNLRTRRPLQLMHAWHSAFTSVPSASLSERCQAAFVMPTADFFPSFSFSICLTKTKNANMNTCPIRFDDYYNCS